MSRQGNNPDRHLLQSLLLSSFYLMWSVNAVTATSLTTVELFFNVEKNDDSTKAKPILDFFDPCHIDELIKQTEAEAVRRCKDRFPYLNWVGCSQSETGQPASTRLEILMKAENQFIPIYLECVPIVEGNRQEGLTATTIVYDNDEWKYDRANVEDPNELLRVGEEVLKTTCKALANLIPDASGLGNVFPIIDTLYADPNEKVLILPVEADDFHAGIGSELFARFVSTSQANSPKAGHIDFEIYDTIVDKQHRYFSMQTCIVNEFTYPPAHLKTPHWCDDIPVALQRQVQDSLRVYMQVYVKKLIGTHSGIVYRP